MVLYITHIGIIYGDIMNRVTPRRSNRSCLKEINYDERYESRWQKEPGANAWASNSSQPAERLLSPVLFRLPSSLCHETKGKRQIYSDDDDVDSEDNDGSSNSSSSSEDEDVENRSSPSSSAQVPLVRNRRAVDSPSKRLRSQTKSYVESIESSSSSNSDYEDDELPAKTGVNKRFDKSLENQLRKGKKDNTRVSARILRQRNTVSEAHRTPTKITGSGGRSTRTDLTKIRDQGRPVTRGRSHSGRAVETRTRLSRTSFTGCSSKSSLAKAGAKKVMAAKHHLRNKSVLASNEAEPLEEVRRRLHPSAIPNYLPCRETEYQTIYEYIKGNVEVGCSGCMYISGVPGTGKTAVVRQSIEALRKAGLGTSRFRFVDVNGMNLTDPSQIFPAIHMQIWPGKKLSPALSRQRLSEYFQREQRKRSYAPDIPTVLLIDELDLLWTRKQQILYEIFNWPTHGEANLTILAIANTLDLPERAMIHRVSSRLGMVRLSFQSYTFQQLDEIIRSRLDGLSGVDTSAVQLVSRKIAAVSGDARRALEVCRRAAELAFQSGSRDARLGIEHVNAALKTMTSAHYIKAIRFASEQEKLFLRSAAAEYRRTGVEETSLAAVSRHLKQLCWQEGYEYPSSDIVAQICDRLAAMRLLVCGQSLTKDYHRKLRLNVTPEDIQMALDDSAVE